MKVLVMLFLMIGLLLSAGLLALNESDDNAAEQNPQYKLTAQHDHGISLIEAAQLTNNFRKTVNPGEKLGGFFGKETIQRLLDQKDCVGIRYYYGLSEENVPVLILVGVNSEGADMLEGELAERAIACPPFCIDSNILNDDFYFEEVRLSSK